jgi:predicted PP-loop superfamily ATPase
MKRSTNLHFNRLLSPQLRIRHFSDTRISPASAGGVEKGAVVKILDWLSLVTAIGKVFLLVIEIRNARRDNDGRSEPS